MIQANRDYYSDTEPQHNSSYLLSLKPGSTYANIAEIRMKEGDVVRWKDSDE